MSRTQPLPGYSVVIGVPVVVFTIEAYWGRYYRGHPWYKDRDHWRSAPHIAQQCVRSVA
ncbi:hypothetical protein [Paraburkholderia pallida]|uniref:hypothetical protein n=1 Tax=Paraburkholderia pallida TaxID=2547399 RepID=UPI001430BB22